MAYTRSPYYRRKRCLAPMPGPVTRFTISGVRPDQLYPRIDTLHWHAGTITGADAQVIALAIEQAEAHGLNLSRADDAQRAIAAIFMPHTVKTSG